MCDPVSIAGAALSAGSTLANGMAAGRVTDARNKALGAERQRQAALDQQATAINDRSRTRYDGFGGQQDTRAQQLGDYFNKGNGTPVTGTGAGSGAPDALPASGSNLVVAEEAKQGAKAAAYGQQQGDALGQLRGFGDMMGTVNRGVARDSGELGQVNSFKQGSAAVTPYELEAADHKGDGLKMFGDLLGGAGKIGLTAGLSRNVLGDVAAPSGSLPSMATPAAMSGSIGGLAAGAPQQSLSLGSLFGGLPSFASGTNAFRVF